MTGLKNDIYWIWSLWLSLSLQFLHQITRVDHPWWLRKSSWPFDWKVLGLLNNAKLLGSWVMPGGTEHWLTTNKGFTYLGFFLFFFEGFHSANPWFNSSDRFDHQIIISHVLPASALTIRFQCSEWQLDSLAYPKNDKEHRLSDKNVRNCIPPQSCRDWTAWETAQKNQTVPDAKPSVASDNLTCDFRIKYPLTQKGVTPEPVWFNPQAQVASHAGHVIRAHGDQRKVTCFTLLTL